MKLLTLAGPALAAVALAIPLIWNAPFMTKGIYRFMFFLGLAALGVIILRPGSSTFVYEPHRNYVALFAASFFTFVVITPYVLLIEVGLSGYRGFSSWMRYVSVSLAALGGVGLIASLLVPRLLRR
jgi:hypothetical protein